MPPYDVIVSIVHGSAHTDLPLFHLSESHRDLDGLLHAIAYCYISSDVTQGQLPTKVCCHVH